MESLRTCLICRKKSIKQHLCRFVRALDGEVRFDEKGELPNRGAWVCARKICLNRAFGKRILFKGERVLPINTESMVQLIESRVKKSALSRLSLMRRLGHVEAGMDAVKRGLSDNRVCAVIFAKDFSNRSSDEIRRNISEANRVLILDSPFVMDEIGQSLGRRKTGVVALCQSRIMNEILLQLNKLKELEQ